MPEQTTRRTSSHIRTSSRRKGQRHTKEQREQAQETFLQAFSMTANIRASCMKAGIDRATYYAWMEHDETFGFRFKQTEAEANDMLRAELWRRAVQGNEKPLVSMGKVVMDKDGKPLTERVYSDQLLSLLLKSRMPEFREKQQMEVSGTIAGVAIYLPQKDAL